MRSLLECSRMKGLGQLFEFNFSKGLNKNFSKEELYISNNKDHNYLIWNLKEKEHISHWHKSDLSNIGNFTNLDIFSYNKHDDQNVKKNQIMNEFESNETISLKVASIYKSGNNDSNNELECNHYNIMLAPLCKCLLGIPSNYFKFNPINKAIVCNDELEMMNSDIFKIFIQCGTKYIRLRGVVTEKLTFAVNHPNYPTIYSFYYVISIYIQCYQNFLNSFLNQNKKQKHISVFIIYHTLKDIIKEFIYIAKILLFIDTEISNIKVIDNIGPRIVDILYDVDQSYRFGFENFSVINFMLRFILQPTYRQISRWIHQGELNYNINDFFIVKKNENQIKDHNWNNYFTIEYNKVPKHLLPYANDILKCGKWIYFFKKIHIEDFYNEMVTFMSSNLTITSFINKCNHYDDNFVFTPLFILQKNNMNKNISLELNNEVKLDHITEQVSTLLHYFVKFSLDKVNITRYIDIFEEFWLLSIGINFEQLFIENFNLVLDYEDFFGEISIFYKLTDYCDDTIPLSIVNNCRNLNKKRRIFDIKFNIPELVQNIISRNVLDKYKYLFQFISRINMTVYEINLIYKDKIVSINKFRPFYRKIFSIIIKFWNSIQNFIEILIRQYYCKKNLINLMFTCKSLDDIDKVHCRFLDNVLEKLFLTSNNNDYNLYSCVIDASALCESLLFRILRYESSKISLLTDKILYHIGSNSEIDDVFIKEDSPNSIIFDETKIFYTILKKCHNSILQHSSDDNKQYLLIILNDYMNTFDNITQNC